MLRKGGNLKKRTTKELSIFSDCRSLYPCAHQGNRKKRRRREHRFPPPAELGRLCVGMMCRFLRLFRPIVLTCFRHYFNHFLYLIQTRSQMRAMESMASPKIILLYLSKF